LLETDEAVRWMMERPLTTNSKPSPPWPVAHGENMLSDKYRVEEAPVASTISISTPVSIVTPLVWL